MTEDRPEYDPGARRRILRSRRQCRVRTDKPMTTAPTTPETILARFAAAYAEHKPSPERRLQVTFFGKRVRNGYIVRFPDDEFLYFRNGHGLMRLKNPNANITRIDYANARYRGAEPLYQKDES